MTRLLILNDGIVVLYRNLRFHLGFLNLLLDFADDGYGVALDVFCRAKNSNDEDFKITTSIV